MHNFVTSPIIWSAQYCLIMFVLRIMSECLLIHFGKSTRWPSIGRPCSSAGYALAKAWLPCSLDSHIAPCFMRLCFTRESTTHRTVEGWINGWNNRPCIPTCIFSVKRDKFILWSSIQWRRNHSRTHVQSDMRDSSSESFAHFASIGTLAYTDQR